MISAAIALPDELDRQGVAFHHAGGAATRSHAFALDCRDIGGGHRTALHLRRANILTSAIGLPTGLDDGLRLGTNEIVRWGATRADMAPLAELIAAALETDDPSSVGPSVTQFRAQFDSIRYIV